MTENCSFFSGKIKMTIHHEEEEKKKRLAILNDKVKDASLKSNEKYIGKTLEVLIDCGVKFTILSPHQAKCINKIGERNWQDVSWGSIDPSRAYRYFVEGTNKEKYIDLFFYDGFIFFHFHCELGFSTQVLAIEQMVHGKGLWCGGCLDTECLIPPW